MVAQLSCQRCGAAFEAKRSDALWCPTCRNQRAKERAKKYDLKHKEPCPGCGKPMVRRANLCIRCENKRRVEAYAGNSNPNWKEGKSSNKGYISVRVKTGSPGKGKGSFYRGEHIVVWERANNKRLPQGWVVHHLNGVKNDNRIENLAGMPRHEHHSHPRKALHPYERRIKQLEDQLHKCQQLKME